MRWTAPILTLALFACKTQDDAPQETGIESEVNEVVDIDGDGFGADEDCDDDNAAVNPEATETCDGVDQDCDGETDEGASDATAWPVDEDGDGYASATGAVLACEPPEGTPELLGDCDDADDDVYPGALEECGDGGGGDKEGGCATVAPSGYGGFTALLLALLTRRRRR